MTTQQPETIRELDTRIVAPRFTLADMEQAAEVWGANCGPAALAVVAGKTIQQIRPYLGDFEQKGYTNPTLMFASLRRLAIRWHQVRDLDVPFGDPGVPWPKFGLCRVQWCGPWTAFGVPPRVAYRHTHWVAAQTVPGIERHVFDVNAMCVGGWIPESEWSGSLVPWLLKECEPKSDGKWFLTHVIEVEPPKVEGEK
jgi:hypothetical protein